MKKVPIKFDRMVEQIKASLRKQFPNRSEKEISSSAYAIARSRWKEKYGTDPLK